MKHVLLTCINLFALFISTQCLLWANPNSGASEIKTQKEWTFLVFVNADNDLDEYGWGDLAEARKLGSTDKVNLVFQIDRSDLRPCRRFFIEKNHAELIENMGEVDMGDYNVLVDFLAWGAENYPAKHYALIVWNHGTGWFRRSNMSMLGVSYDDQSGNYITTNQLSTATSQIKDILGRKLDILAFDACLMQMVEVAWAVKNNVELMVGSEEVIPYDGFAYDTGFEAILANPEASLQEISSILVEGYVDSYEGGSQGNESTTLSWLDLERVESLAGAIDSFVEIAIGKEKEVVASVLQDVQHYDLRSNRDLRHFMMLLAARTSDSAIQLAANTVIAAFDEFVGFSQWNDGGESWQPDLANSHGCAIYFPTRASAFNEQYLDLDFAKDTQWDTYIRNYYEIQAKGY